MTHSEFNASDKNNSEVLQIWILLREEGLKPSYEQKSFEQASFDNKFRLLVSPDGREGSITVQQEVYFSRAVIPEKAQIEYTLKNNANGLFVFMINGCAAVGSEEVANRDALAIKNLEQLLIVAKSNLDILIIETPINKG